jgi:hypothetical protein
MAQQEYRRGDSVRWYCSRYRNTLTGTVEKYSHGRLVWVVARRSGRQDIEPTRRLVAEHALEKNED